MTLTPKTGLAWVVGLEPACRRSTCEGQVPAAKDTFSKALVSVVGRADARVFAVAIDRNGLRSGRTADGKLDEIAGCGHRSGPEDGSPIVENWPDDTATMAVPEPPLTEGVPDTGSIDSDGPQPSPRYHEFYISNDAVTSVELIDQGGCELRLDPVVAGKVQLGLSATGVGFSACKDTTSVWVTPGAPLRWRLRWKATRERCVVKLARIRG